MKPQWKAQIISSLLRSFIKNMHFLWTVRITGDYLPVIYHRAYIIFFKGVSQVNALLSVSTSQHFSFNQKMVSSR